MTIGGNASGANNALCKVHHNLMLQYSSKECSDQLLPKSEVHYFPRKKDLALPIEHMSSEASSAQMTSSEPETRPTRAGRMAGVGLRPSLTPTAQSLTPVSRRITPVPQSLLSDPELQRDIATLPSNYSFEIPKTIHRIRQTAATRIALQMPEGLLMYATTISDIILTHTQAIDTVVLGDVTYGACCVDDLSARALNCDFLVHYGHSCLVPVTQTTIPTMYVFVHIAFDPSHLRETLLQNFARETRLAIVATIQFVDTAHDLRQQISQHFANVSVPQKRPLSPGELLGCTSPTIQDADALIYIGDGRFHLESAMIANPQLRAYRYDPYEKVLTEENYHHSEMRALRHVGIEEARTAQRFGVILGTLGRQGSPKILTRVLAALRSAGRQYFVVLLSEITPAKIVKMESTGVQAWVQIACPRLSIDWGAGYGKRPLLTTYEAFVALGKTEWREIYPMDFYAKDGGEWSNYWKGGQQKRRERLRRVTAPSS